MIKATAANRLLQLLTKPPRSPVLQLTLYFAGLVAMGALLVRYVPLAGAIIAGPLSHDALGDGGLRDLLAAPVGPSAGPLMFDLRMAIVMLGTLLITIPFSWGYMAIRERGGYEQSVVQTLVILPSVVAAIMMIVQDSLALAFALGGVAAAVRFRNTLKDVADATYVFLAIGIGIASGTGSLSGALVMTAMFTYASVLLWWCGFGECEITPSHIARAVSENTVRDKSRPVARREMTVEARDVDARARIEDALDRVSKRWKLRRASPNESGGSSLVYDVRLKRKDSPDRLLQAIRALADQGVGTPRFLPNADDART